MGGGKGQLFYLTNKPLVVGRYSGRAKKKKRERRDLTAPLCLSLSLFLIWLFFLGVGKKETDISIRHFLPCQRTCTAGGVCEREVLLPNQQRSATFLLLFFILVQ